MNYSTSNDNDNDNDNGTGTKKNDNARLFAIDQLFETVNHPPCAKSLCQVSLLYSYSPQMVPIFGMTDDGLTCSDMQHATCMHCLRCEGAGPAVKLSHNGWRGIQIFTT
jgi:hypothetical protein